MKTQWTEQTKVEAVIKATGASADDARDYLVAEEGSVEDAIISYEGDKYAMNRETVVKYLRDAVPLGEHPSPHAEFITVRLDTVQAAADAIEAFDDDKEWIEKGLAEWRGMALENAKHAEMARATARVAINHLQSVLNKPRTHAQQQDADTAARDWLLSIGSEPQ